MDALKTMDALNIIEELEAHEDVQMIVYKGISIICVDVFSFFLSKALNIRSLLKNAKNVLHPIIFIIHNSTQYLQYVTKNKAANIEDERYKKLYTRIETYLGNYLFESYKTEKKIFSLFLRDSWDEECTRNKTFLMEQIQNIVNKRLLMPLNVYQDIPLTYTIKQEGKLCAMTSLIAGLTLFRSIRSEFSITAHELLNKFGKNHLNYDDLGCIELSKAMNWNDMWPNIKDRDFEVLQKVSDNNVEIKEIYDESWNKTLVLMHGVSSGAKLVHGDYELVFVLVASGLDSQNDTRFNPLGKDEGHRFVVYISNNIWFLYDTNVGEPKLFTGPVFDIRDTTTLNEDPFIYDSNKNYIYQDDGYRNELKLPGINEFRLVGHHNAYVYSRRKKEKQNEYLESFGGRSHDHMRTWLIAMLLFSTLASAFVPYTNG